MKLRGKEVLQNRYSGTPRKLFFPPKVGYQLTPSNFLEVVRPFSNYGKVVGLLGEPHHVWKAQASYRFKDSLLQIERDDDNVITAVTLATLKRRWPHRFRVHPLEFVLGRDTFRDVFPEKEIVLSHNGSSKFERQWQYCQRYRPDSDGMNVRWTWRPLRGRRSERQKWVHHGLLIGGGLRSLDVLGITQSSARKGLSFGFALRR